MSKLAVSAVIPTYNRAHLIARAINSVLESLGPDDEVIVVSDGSTDGTVGEVEAFGDRVRLLQQPHAGAGPARNAGIAAARGQLIALLDSDDEWFPDKIALQRAFLEQRPDVNYVFSDFGVRLEDRSERRRYLSHWLPKPRPIPEVLDAVGAPYTSVAPLPPGREDFQVYVGSMYLQMMRSNIIPSFTLMTRRNLLLFPDDQVTGEDWQAYGRLAGMGMGAYFDTETAWQHGHAGERLTDLPSHRMADAWLAALERVWGRDQSFLAENDEEYQRAISAANLAKARSLARNWSGGKALLALRAAGASAIIARAAEWFGETFSNGPPA